MKDATIIRLSADALDRLFPDGTDARLQLQQAVLGEVAGRYIKAALGEHQKAYIDGLVRRIASAADLDKLVSDSFLKQGYAGRLVPNPSGSVAAAIAEAVSSKVTDAIHDYIAKCVDESLAEAVEKAKETAEYIVHKHINNETADMLNKKVQDAWRKTVAQLSSNEQ